MEVKLNEVTTKEISKININFTDNEITSLIGSNKSEINNVLKLLYEDEKLIEENIFYLKEEYKGMLFNINVLEDIKYYVKEIKEEKLYDLLKLFSLDYSICKKNYLELSSSEYKKVLLLISIMINCKILILENPTLNLDYKSIQNLIRQLKKL